MYDPETKEAVGKETQVIVTKENAKEAIGSLLFLGNTENIYVGYTKIIDIINVRFHKDLKKLHRAGIYNSINDSKGILETLTKSETDYILEKSSIDYYYWEISQNTKP